MRQGVARRPAAGAANGAARAGRRAATATRPVRRSSTSAAALRRAGYASTTLSGDRRRRRAGHQRGLPLLRQQGAAVRGGVLRHRTQVWDGMAESAGEAPTMMAGVESMLRGRGGRRATVRQLLPRRHAHRRHVAPRVRTSPRGAHQVPGQRVPRARRDRLAHRRTRRAHASMRPPRCCAPSSWAGSSNATSRGRPRRQHRRDPPGVPPDGHRRPTPRRGQP